VRARNIQTAKSIGSSWVGPIPNAWSVARVKHLSTIYAGGTPDRESKEYWEDGTIPWLNSGEVNQWLITQPSTFITEEGYRHSSAKWIPKRALVMALAGQGKTKGMVAQLGIEATCNQSMAAIVPSERAHPRFLQWWLHANYETIRNLAGGEQRDGLNLEIVGNIPCPQPSTLSQRAIADYLDRETARLDALVEAKERVLVLLAEKRRALITQAVTRGLNQHVHMRTTNIEWIPQAPRHWTQTKISRLFQQTKRLGFADLTVLSVYRDYGVIERSSRDDNANRVPDDLEKYQLVEPGDLVINKMKAWQGSLGISEHRGITSPDYVVFRPLHHALSKFLHYLLRNQILTTVYFSMSNGIRTSQWRLEPDRFGTLQLFLPPIDEQREVVDHIIKETAKLDALHSSTERTILLIKERRAALIAAAVTGKIDVGT
jgi:type I restriction enzyme, S subunit